MPSICRRIRTRLPTYLSTGLGTFVAIVISAARTPFFSWFKHECNRSHAIWRYPQPLPSRGPTKPIVRPSPQRYRKTSTAEINRGTRHREVVQLAKRVWIYPAAERGQGCVCPYLGCRESRPQ